MKKLTLFIALALFIQSTVLAQPCLPDGITFTTQEQIDNFQINYPNCTEIEGGVEISGDDITNLNVLSVVTSIGGDLYIGSNDSLISLTGLDNLTSIGGGLEIYNNDSLTSLTGLEGLTSIVGGLIFRSNGALTSLTGLENVTSIGGDLSIYWNGNLTSLTGLEGLTSIGGGLSIRTNAVLSNCEAQWLCDYLSNPNGSIDIYHNATGCNNPPEIANACDVTLPCLPFGNYYFFTQSQIDNFPNHYPNCTEIEGDAEINGDDITNLNGLNVVTSIGGDLLIGDNNPPYSGNSILLSLAGLDNLTYIGGNFAVYNNQALTSLSGLENVTFIGGDLHIGGGYVGNTQLTSLTGLEGLTSIEGNLYIGGLWGGNALLDSLTGLDNVTSIGEDLFITFNTTLTNLTGLANVTSIGGSIFISCNKALTSLTGLENITAIQGNLRFGGDDWYSHYNNLTNLSGLDNVTSIGGDLSIDHHVFLTDITGLNNLTSIGGGLFISRSGNLSSLTGLDNVTSIGGDLVIRHNNTLTSLTGLDNIDAASIDNLFIRDNTSLSKCEVQSICDYLLSPNGNINIYDNALGCNHQDEVEKACPVSVDEVDVSDKLIIYPNPSSTQITIELPNTQQKNALLTIYNMKAQQVLTHHITEQKTVIDISSLPEGFYFVKVADDRTMIVGKIVKK